VGPSIRPVPFTNPDGSEGADLYLAPEAFREAFAADVDPDTAAVMAAAQRPYAATALAAAPSGPLAWKTLPCWYLLGTEDKAIPPTLQRFMAERANARIVEVAGRSRLLRVAARGRDPAHPSACRGHRARGE
jgi:pimeloyl-ACP methyl ester carboxylesterase